MASDATPLLLFLTIIIVFGGVMSIITGFLGFTPEQYVATLGEEETLTTFATIQTIQNARVIEFSIFGYELSFTIIPEFAYNFLASVILGMALLPNFLATAIYIIFGVGAVYSFIKLLPTT